MEFYGPPVWQAGVVAGMEGEVNKSGGGRPGEARTVNRWNLARALSAIVLLAGSAHAGGLQGLADVVGIWAQADLDVRHGGPDPNVGELITQEPSVGPYGVRGVRCLYDFPDGSQRWTSNMAFCETQVRR